MNILLLTEKSMCRHHIQRRTLYILGKACFSEKIKQKQNISFHNVFHNDSEAITAGVIKVVGH